MINNHLEKESFNRIRYANCWEDADILLEALKPSSDDVILSIGSGGDNSFSLLSCNPHKVIIYDISQVQLYLIELKKTAFGFLDYLDFKRFVGFEECDFRKEIYHSQLRKKLSVKAKYFWDKKQKEIQNGIINAGKFENYFRLYRKWIQPVLASSLTVKEFFEHPSSLADIERYKQKLAKPLPRKFFKLFFSKQVIAMLGRSPGFFKEVRLNVADYLLETFIGFLENKTSYRNHYVFFIANGRFPDVLPQYAREESFDTIKQNLDKLILKKGLLEHAVEQEKEISMINASDIFEYIDKVQFRSFAVSLIKHCKPGTRIVYWNLLVDRLLSSVVESGIQFNKEQSDKLTAKDKLFFYKRFIIETITG